MAKTVYLAFGTMRPGVRTSALRPKSLENAKFSRLFLCLLPTQILRADDCFSSALNFIITTNWNLSIFQDMSDNAFYLLP